jgi:ferredoxin-NADP reductase
MGNALVGAGPLAVDDRRRGAEELGWAGTRAGERTRRRTDHARDELAPPPALVVVSGSGVTPVNAQLRTAARQETVTVTAHSPIVDTQSTRREVVLSAQTINTMAATRGYNVFNANFDTARRVSEAGTFPALESPNINHVVENCCSGDGRTGRIQWRRLQSRPNRGTATGDAADPGGPGGCACRAG